MASDYDDGNVVAPSAGAKARCGSYKAPTPAPTVGSAFFVDKSSLLRDNKPQMNYGVAVSDVDGPLSVALAAQDVDRG